MAAKKPRPAPSYAITQADLLGILTEQAIVDQMEEALKAQKTLLLQRKSEILSLVQAGETVEPGEFTAGISIAMGRCSPAWKEEYLSHMTVEHGLDRKAAEMQVQLRYPAQPKAPELAILRKS